MQSKITFVVLFMLSFSVLHDSFLSLLDKGEHISTVHHMSDTVLSSECTELDEIHNIFHFMAIVTLSKNTQLHFAKEETTSHLTTKYTPPLKKTSYKPPIA